MDNSLPFEVVCINAGVIDRRDGTAGAAPTIDEGKTYLVIKEGISEYGTLGYKLQGVNTIHNSEGFFNSSRFRRISPYQNSVTRSLAEQALKDSGDSSQDMKPVKVKEVQDAV